MDESKLTSSDELLTNETSKFSLSKMGEEVYGWVKDHPLESAGAAVFAAADIGATIADRDVLGQKTVSESEATESLASSLSDKVGKLIQLGPGDAGVVTNARIGDTIDLFFPFNRKLFYPAMLPGRTDSAVLKLENEVLQNGVGIGGTFKVIGNGEESIRLYFSGQVHEFPIKVK